MTTRNRTSGSTKKKIKRTIIDAVAHISASFNNTIITIADKSGNVLAWASAGASGFKGSRKSTPFAAGMSAEAAGKQAMEYGMKKLEVFTKGTGPGKETAIRSLQGIGLEVTLITDITPTPHNGCRPPKSRTK